jgi:hypothetical protein
VKVQSVNELRDKIVKAAEYVTKEMLANTCQRPEYRLDVCHVTDGAQIEIY